jgi:hypothetical protein
MVCPGTAGHASVAHRGSHDQAFSRSLHSDIAARVLGHANLGTTQAYLAVFQDELVRAYRAFLDKRRAFRPEAEYREPTDQEWQEFHQHFQLRKLELGECGRPYGTPCKHEFACLRCPSMRLDPKARPRLVEIIANLRDRIKEAKLNGWLGEVQGLQTSLNEATKKLVSLDRSIERSRKPTEASQTSASPSSSQRRPRHDQILSPENERAAYSGIPAAC